MIIHALDEREKERERVGDACMHAKREGQARCEARHAVAVRMRTAGSVAEILWPLEPHCEKGRRKSAGQSRVGQGSRQEA